MKKKSSKEFGSTAGPSKQMVLISEGKVFFDLYVSVLEIQKYSIEFFLILDIKFNVQKDPNLHYLEIINLRHPRYNRSAKFIFNNENNTICEILKFSLPHRLDLYSFSYRMHLLI